MSLLLDSVILIDHLNGIPEATAYLRKVKEQCLISVITRAEVLSGVAADKVLSVGRLLDEFPTLAMDREAADVAARLRRRHRWNSRMRFRPHSLKFTV